MPSAASYFPSNKKPMNRFHSSLTPRLLKAAAGLTLTSVPAIAQTTFDWTGTTGGSWETGTNWTPNAAGSTFTNLDTAQLTKNFTAATWTLDGAATVNKLIFEDTGTTGDIAGVIDAGTGGSLTLGGTNPTIETRNSLTISAPISGSSGFTKTGANGLTLSGNNSGLSGTLTVADPGATNNGGVFVNSLEALGGITTVTVQGQQGTTPTGGFFRLNGTGITVPSTVTFNLSGQGGNSAPTGTLVGGGTGINEIQGTINLLTNGVRISNSGATRLDISGQITGSFQATFRFADNEGVHLTNTSNNWTGPTTHSQGVLWYEPGTLPSGHLTHAASGAGSIQTSGSFTRSLAASGADAMLSQYVQNGNRETGFSARGGALTVNLGGAGADVKFFNFAQQNGTWTSGSNTISMTNTAGYVVGMVVAGGTGLPANATITAVSPTSLTINNPTTAAQTAAVAVPGSQNNATQWNTNILNLNWNQADSKLTFENGLDLNGASRTISVRANTAEISGVIKNTHATVTGAGITKNGVAGTLLLTGANTFTGNVNVNEGRLEIRSAAALGLQNGTGNKTVTLTNGTAGNPQLALDGSGGAIDLPSWIVFSTSNNTRAAILNVGGNNIVRGNVTLASGGGGTQIQSDADKLTLTGNFTPSVTTRDLRLAGAGDLELSGVIANGATVNMPVRKIGTGTLTLSGNSTYTGTTTLEGGLTLVNGSLGNTATTVKTTATLGGSGTIGGDVTLEAGGTISPGNSPGILTVGSLTTQGGSLNIELNGTTPGTEYDQLAISSVGGGTGSVSLGTTVINLSLGYTPALNDKFFILLNDGTDNISGNLYSGATPLLEGDVLSLGGHTFSISYLDNGDGGTVGNDISLTAIPEPSTAVLGVVGLSALLLRRK